MSDFEPLIAGIRISATPDEVFPYFVDPSLLIRWIGMRGDLDPVPGGAFELDFESISVRGEYVEVDPPHRVVFTWGVPGSEDLPVGSSTVEVNLRADGEETVVELIHHNLVPVQAENHRQGWVTCLATLAQVASRGQ